MIFPAYHGDNRKLIFRQQIAERQVSRSGGVMNPSLKFRTRKLEAFEESFSFRGHAERRNSLVIKSKYLERSGKP